MAGAAGLLVALLLSLLLFVIAPLVPALALLGAERSGSVLAAQLFLMALGLIAVLEFPLTLFLLVQLARRTAAPLALLGFHFAYTLFPGLYGALGVLLTGERWWLWVMLLLATMRFVSSALAIDPQTMAERHARGKETSLVDTFFSSDGATPMTPTTRGGAAAPRLRQLQGFILDMDGVLYRGSTVRDGTLDFIEYLNAERIPYVCLTNNASRTSEMYQEKLDHLGIPIRSDHVLGAAQATAEWLRGEAVAGARVLPVGEAGLREELVRAGFTLVSAPPADFVVVGIDFQLTYDKLKQAALAIRANARFIGTNPDSTFPSEEGLVPGNGAVLAYLQAATGVEPTIIGKPSRPMMQLALDHVGLPAGEVAMVGDRLNTDIVGGQAIGVTTILLLGGVTSQREAEDSPIKADGVYQDLGDLLKAYRRARERVMG